MAKKDTYEEIKFFMPEFRIDPLERAVKEIERIIFESGLPYSMEYRPDDGYFTLKIEKTKEN